MGVGRTVRDSPRRSGVLAGRTRCLILWALVLLLGGPGVLAQPGASASRQAFAARDLAPTIILVSLDGWRNIAGGVASAVAYILVLTAARSASMAIRSRSEALSAIFGNSFVNARRRSNDTPD